MRRTIIAALGTPILAALLLGVVLAWGNAAPAAANVPAPAAATELVTAISANGIEDACALKDGGAWCWGRSGHGALGNNSTTPCNPALPSEPCSSVPAPVSGLTSGVTAISTGYWYTCWVKDGGALCSGFNGSGQLGDGTTTESHVPVAVSGMGSGVTTISARAGGTCALKDGGVWCWGLNGYGGLGNGTTADSHVPVAVSGMGSGVTAISSGGFHSCALKDGGVWCWGYNGDRQLGNNSTTPCNPALPSAPCSSVPAPVSGLTSGVTAISSGDSYTCAVKGGGALCWGSNGSGQLGDGTTTRRSAPVAVSGMGSGVTAISAGSAHTCAVRDGGASCWGSNGSGQLGNNSLTESHAPVAVSGMGSGVSAISAGVFNTCVLQDGGVWCWGNNTFGQLGNNSLTDSHVPLAVVEFPAMARWRLPWEVGQSWRYTQTPHAWDDRPCNNEAGAAACSALDFNPVAGSCPTVQSAYWVYPVAGGTITDLIPDYGHIEIDHGGGWRTVYEHVALDPVFGLPGSLSNGQLVTTSTRLGHTSCVKWPGAQTPTGPHLHIALCQLVSPTGTANTCAQSNTQPAAGTTWQWQFVPITGAVEFCGWGVKVNGTMQRGSLPAVSYGDTLACSAPPAAASVLSLSATITQGELTSYAVTIPPAQAAMGVFLGWEGSTVNGSLTAPDGTTIGPETVAPNVSHSKGSDFEYYQVASPAAGQWTLHVYGADLPPGGEAFALAISSAAAIPPAVGGIAEEPDVAALSAQTSAASGGNRTVYAVGGAVAVALVLFGAGGWAMRRRRSE